jgi:hypothetical protein
MANFEWGGKPYTLTKNMIEDGKKMMLLNKGAATIPLTCPVRLIQGLGDEEIPPERALKLSDSIQVRHHSSKLKKLAVPRATGPATLSALHAEPDVLHSWLKYAFHPCLYVVKYI